MRLRKKNKKRTIIILAIVAILVIGAGVTTYILWPRENTNESTVTNDGDNKEDEEDSQTQTDQDTNSQATEAAPQSPIVHEDEKDIAQPYEGSNINSSSSLSGTITYSAVSGDTVIIRTTVDQVIGSGNCEIVLSNGAKTVTKTSNIAQNPSSSTCEGFDIPVVELGAGNWNIAIEIKDTRNRNVTLTGTVNI